jgi:hypothetical protein
MRTPIAIAAALAVLVFPISSHAIDCLARATKKAEKGHTQDAIEVLEKGALKGDERCQFVLGMWSLTGRGMPPDPESGAKWLKKAAQDGLPIAQVNLGLLYASGIGVERDTSVAAAWYRKAAEYGDPLGQAAYSAALFLGRGIEKNPLDGYVWTSLAAAQGNEKAQSFIPGMEQALTDDDLGKARTRIAEFRPKKIPKAKRWRPSERLYDSRDSARQNARNRQQGARPR